MGRKATLLFVMFIALFSALLVNQHVTRTKAQTSPAVSVIFPNTTNSSYREYRPGDTFRVNITVDSPDVGVWSWQAGIYFDNNVLNCTGLGEGDFFAGKPTLGFYPGTINNTLGYVTFSSASLRNPETTGVKGTGVLMWLEFHVIGDGPGLLDLTSSPPDLTCGTKLNERADTDVTPISPIHLRDGSIEAIPEFPSATILQLFIGFTLVTGVFAKLHRKKR